MTERLEEELPFDVEMEAPPRWGHGASAAVVATAALVAARVLPAIAVAPLLVASSLARRFATSPAHVVVDDEGLWVGDAPVVEGRDIVDVWLDDEPRELRVAVTTNHRLFVFYFENRDQAERFAGALGPKAARAAGYRPRRIDLLGSLRFVALAAALMALGSWVGALTLLLALPGLWVFVTAKQIVARDEGFVLSTWRTSATFAYGEIASVDEDAVRTKDGRTLTLARRDFRDPLLAAPEWTDRARRRALAHVAARVRVHK